MGDPARRDATYADLLEVPEHVVAEIVDGELITSPRPALRQALASSALGGELSGPFQRGRGGPGGWWIVDEPELHSDARCWCQTSPGGGRNGSLSSPTRLP